MTDGLPNAGAPNAEAPLEGVVDPGAPAAGAKLEPKAVAPVFFSAVWPNPKVGAVFPNAVAGLKKDGVVDEGALGVATDLGVAAAGFAGGELGGVSSSKPAGFFPIPITGDGGGDSSKSGTPVGFDVSSAEAKLPRPKSSFSALAVGAGEGEDLGISASA